MAKLETQKPKNIKTEVPVISFASQKKWEQWLSKNHTHSLGIWMKIYKKASGIKSVNYSEALDEALCYGWIDGQKNKFDSESYLQKFTPRRAKSMWSKINIAHVARLEKAGKMKPSGQSAVASAKADGRWKQAYDSPSKMVMPKDFLKELAKNKKAKIQFASLNKTNLYAIAWRLQTAKKDETRKKRMIAIITMLEKGESIH